MVVKFGRYSLGFTHDVVTNDSKPYLERWILWFGLSLRVHRFLESDQDRAPHDHPWWFITFPCTAYDEHYVVDGVEHSRTVKPWRLHFRSAHLRHRVEVTRVPSWTIVLTGLKSKEWGFWENEAEFVHHRDWLNP
jgi:hypothetical protein